MILIGVGANLPSPRHGPPRATCGAALAALVDEGGLTITARSRWYRSAPVPASDQPWYVNGLVRVETSLDPPDLLRFLLRTEVTFGRRRGARNAPRVLDLDLLAYGDLVTARGGDGRSPDRETTRGEDGRSPDRETTRGEDGRNPDRETTKGGGPERGGPEGVVLPHPRMHERAFVLLPVLDVAPGWRHPVLGLSVEDLIQALPPGQRADVMADADGAYGTEWARPSH